MNSMLEKINKHRERYPQGRKRTQDKLIEECIELIKDFKKPTSKANRRKEIGDVMIMLQGHCVEEGYDLETIVDETIEINERRNRKYD